MSWDAKYPQGYHGAMTVPLRARGPRRVGGRPGDHVRHRPAGGGGRHPRRTGSSRTPSSRARRTSWTRLCSDTSPPDRCRPCEYVGPAPANTSFSRCAPATPGVPSSHRLSGGQHHLTPPLAEHAATHLREDPMTSAPAHRPMPGAIRIVLGHSQALYREGLRRLLSRADLELLAVAGDAAGLHEAVEANQPDVVIADPPAGADLRRCFPQAGILIVANRLDDETTPSSSPAGPPGSAICSGARRRRRALRRCHPLCRGRRDDARPTGRGRAARARSRPAR